VKLTCLKAARNYLVVMKKNELPPDHISAIIEMALSDHVSFANIQTEYGITDKQVKTLMRDSLKSGSYKAWRKRIRDFGDRREIYK
jgi:uncharacterized protein (TIGR03643 family)